MPTDRSVLHALTQALLGLPALAALTTPRSDKFLNIIIFREKKKKTFPFVCVHPGDLTGGSHPVSLAIPSGKRGGRSAQGVTSVRFSTAWYLLGRLLACQARGM